MKYTINMIDDYQNRLTENQKQRVIKHCNIENITPCICAWYDDKEDFYSDWCEEIGYSQEDADELLNCNRDNRGEFLIFEDNQIIRFSI